MRALSFCFEIVSELEVNLLKSEMVLVGSLNIIQCLTNIMGCKVSSFPLKYAGLPLGAAFKAKTIWEGVFEKIERIMQEGWKKIICQTGRITLSKALYLTSLHSFFLYFFYL